MPASSQQSPTSGTRLASAPQLAQCTCTASIHGRCSSGRLSTTAGSTAMARSSSNEPGCVTSPQLSQTQKGSGRPQKRLREMHQSRMLLSQSCMRLPASSGYHFTCAAAAFMRGRISSALMNHSETTRKTRSVPQRQQTG